LDVVSNTSKIDHNFNARIFQHVWVTNSREF
jgi:hypothetical protein